MFRDWTVAARRQIHPMDMTRTRNGCGQLLLHNDHSILQPSSLNGLGVVGQLMGGERGHQTEGTHHVRPGGSNEPTNVSHCVRQVELGHLGGTRRLRLGSIENLARNKWLMRGLGGRGGFKAEERLSRLEKVLQLNRLANGIKQLRGRESGGSAADICALTGVAALEAAKGCMQGIGEGG